MYSGPHLMNLANILIALWAVLVAAGFVCGTTFPSGTISRVAAFLAPVQAPMPGLPGPVEWLARLARIAFPVVIALLVAASARGAGRAVSGLVSFPRRIRWWMNYAVGGGMLSFLVFGLGLAGLLYQPMLYVLFAPFCFRGIWRSALPSFRGSGLSTLLELASVITLAVWVLGVLVPEPGIDAYLYHLRLPFYYLMNHRIYSVWHHIHGHVPQIWEVMLAVFPREISATGAQALSALTGLAVWKMALERSGGSPGYKAGLLLVMSSPLVSGIGTSAYTDLPLMWLEFGVFLILVPPSGFPSKSSIFWAGAVLGLATSLKYASFPAFAAALILVIVQSVRCRSAGLLLPAVAGFFAVFWPWLAWNSLATGNPLSPFLGGLFPDSLPQLPFAERLSNAVFSRTLLNMLQSPWNAFIRCEPYLFLAPLLAAFAPLALDANRRKGTPYAAFAWVMAFFTAWAVFMADERFALGAIPVLLLLLPGLDALRAWKTVFVLFMALNLFGVFRQQLVPLDRLWSAIGLVSRQEYFSRHISPAPGYMQMVSWLNSNTGIKDRILFVSDFKSPYIWRECINDHVYDYPTRLVYLLKNALHEPERVAVRFRQLGIRWVVYLPTVNTARLAQMPDLFDFNPQISRAWGGFWAGYASPQAAFPPVFVYGINRKPVAPRMLYHLPGVGDVVRINGKDLLKTQGQQALIDFMRKVVKVYPAVAEFRRMLGDELVRNPATAGEGREHLRISRKAELP